MRLPARYLCLSLALFALSCQSATRLPFAKSAFGWLKRTKHRQCLQSGRATHDRNAFSQL